MELFQNKEKARIGRPKQARDVVLQDCGGDQPSSARDNCPVDLQACEECDTREFDGLDWSHYVRWTRISPNTHQTRASHHLPDAQGMANTMRMDSEALPKPRWPYRYGWVPTSVPKTDRENLESQDWNEPNKIEYHLQFNSQTFRREARRHCKPQLLSGRHHCRYIAQGLSAGATPEKKENLIASGRQNP